MGFFEYIGICFLKLKYPFRLLALKGSQEDETRQRKVFNDSVHGHIELHPVCVKILDTPEFQRLRYIKQLGGAYFVYPGAAHNRFEHSIGVSYLAGKFARTLQKNQPKLGITDKDILCVEIAGLCHDLGHGPFSHLFDDMVVPEFIPKENNPPKHEDISLRMFDYMVTQNGLQEVFDEEGINEDDILFIKEQIRGPLDGKKTNGWDYKGRFRDKRFLYQIVSNKESGIDVDKWDYFARDSLMLGMKSNFNHLRAIAFARVLDVAEEQDGKIVKIKHICYRDKEFMNFYDMFNTRYLLHRRACHHRVTAAIQIMVAEAFIKAINSNSDEVKFRGKDGTLLNMVEALDDMEAFSQITDDMLMRIYHSRSKRLKEARLLIDRILKRDLYKFIGSKQLKEKTYKSQEAVFEEMKTKGLSDELKKDVVVHLVDLNYGKMKDNPIRHVWFFRKSDPEKPIHLSPADISYLLPECFSEQQVIVYCRSKDEDIIEKVTKIFERWSKSLHQ